jgi:hypothetical protein
MAQQPAGYSGTPLVRKLGIKADTRALLIGAPAGFERQLAELPDGARIVRRSAAAVERVLLFCASRAALLRSFDAAERRVLEGGGLWIAWPKKAAGTKSDLTESFVRDHGLASGWVDYKICAIDETWSGLLFARRRKT